VLPPDSRQSQYLQDVLDLSVLLTVLALPSGVARLSMGLILNDLCRSGELDA
jgi:hypothetical protein